MKKIIFSIITIVFLSITATAQTGAKSVYVELGGAGIASVNYDMRILKKEKGLGFRVGVGKFFSPLAESSLLVPLGLNYLFGKDDGNFIEIGAGVTLAPYRNYFTDNSIDFSSSFYHAYLGYRFQPKNSGFLFRVGITPIFDKYSFVPYWAGISFGYKF
jgi:hypothetical protein